MRIVDRLLSLLYPAKCTFCHKLTRDGERICQTCRAELPRTPHGAQVQKFPFISACVSPLYYEKDVRESLLRYKFHHLTAYAEIYAVFMAETIDENHVSCDIITWVPLSRKRLRKRGYDQARLLAEQLSRIYRVECCCLLRKKRNNPAQSGTGSAEKRRANVTGVYTAVEQEKIKGKTILLVDDIVTTGSTLSECARMLLEAGAKEVRAVTVARKRN